MASVCADSENRKSVAAVVVTYNRKDLLLECLDCLCKQDLGTLGERYGLSVIVVDNASTDGTEEALAVLAESGKIAYFNTGENLGGAGGFNYGMRKAVELGYDYVWVMDDDCMTHPDTLREFLIAGESLNGEYGYLTSVCLWTDGTPCSMNRQRHPLHHTIEDFTPELQPCTLASFVSLFVPADVIAELGLPIKEFFIWTDDWEFTRRVSRKYPCYVVGTSVVTHKCKVNGAGNVAIDSGERIARFRLAYRNDIVLYRGEGPAGYAYVAARDLNHLWRIATEAKGRKLERARAVLGGTFEGLRFHPEIEYVKRSEKH
ncbi:glycosyltransferase [uncultured Parolsenella sp.]|uniref:glycosyltransferase n=1 Tax=uncultured Parolsenella sp. TaxID=2083008 RepID=UPI0025F06A56|nr:glycosyltransferase [uncultured Parolsenella sp.]